MCRCAGVRVCGCAGAWCGFAGVRAGGVRVCRCGGVRVADWVTCVEVPVIDSTERCETEAMIISPDERRGVDASVHLILQRADRPSTQHVD